MTMLHGSPAPRRRYDQAAPFAGDESRPGGPPPDSPGDAAERIADPFHQQDGPIPIEEFRDRILELYRPPLRAKGTWMTMRLSLRLLMELPGLESTADLTTATIARFVAARAEAGEHPNNTRTHLRRLSAACSIAVAEGWTRVNPFSIRRSWVRGTPPKAPRIHSREELGRVLDLAAAEILRAHPARRWRARRLYALIATVCYTGLRRNEALTLKVADVRLDERIIYLTSRSGASFKTEASAAPVPIPEALAPILRGWLAHVDPGGYVFPSEGKSQRPWTGGPAGARALDAMKTLGERAGVPGLTFRSLRHCWATHAEYFGLSPAMIQRVLRHTNASTQWHYRHPDPANLRSMVAGFDLRGAAPAESEAPGPAVAPPPRPRGADPAMVEFRPIPEFPGYRIGSDRSVVTEIRPGGREGFGNRLGPWRPVRVCRRGSADVVHLRRDGRSYRRSLDVLMQEAFGDLPERT